MTIELLPWQKDVKDDPAHLKIAITGRRAGKTTLAAWFCDEVIYMGRRMGKTFLAAHGIHKGGSLLVLDGSKDILSGLDAGALKGSEFKLVVLDNAEHVADLTRLYAEHIKPMLLDNEGSFVNNGTFIALGTPDKDLNLRRFVLNTAHAARTWHIPTVENPYIAAAQLEEFKDECSYREYMRSFMGVFE